MSIEIVVALSSKDFGIGASGRLPWHIRPDLARFASITAGSIVVMGRKTYDSIPGGPLKGRTNVVVSGSDRAFHPDVIAMKSLESVEEYVHSQNKTAYVIGGSSLYAAFMGKATRIHATLIDRRYDCDTFFPTDAFGMYDIETYSPLLFDEHERVDYRFVTYVRRSGTVPHGEYAYLDIVHELLDEGSVRPDRTGVGTLSAFGKMMRFDISSSIPLYTTKFVSPKMVLSELLWFLHGRTDSKLLEADGVNIWRANTSRDFLDARGLGDYREGDTGPLYGINLRSYGARYHGCDHDHRGQGIDQISRLVQGLRDDPFSRRHIVTTFNPSTVDECVLYPCHGICIMCYVDESHGQCYLSTMVTVRSNDIFLGNPANVASYAIFTHLIAKMVDMKPKELVLSIGDAHLYQNHVDQARLLLARRPLPFPTIKICDTVRDKTIDDITMEDIEVVAYLHHASIKAPMAV